MKKKNIGYLYICDSMYHIYLSLLKSRFLLGNHSIIIKDTIPDYKNLSKRLIESGFFNKVSIINELRLIRKKNPLILFNLSYYFKPLPKEIIEEEYKIFLFLDTTFYAKFLIKYYPTIDITLVEDGEQIYANYHSNYRDLVKKIFKLPLGYGRDKAVNSIEVQYPNRINSNLKNKTKLLNIISLQNIHKKEINVIFSVFGFSLDVLKSKSFSILLTQPLSEDNFISEEEKVMLYKKIIVDYMKGESIVIKVHPREKTDYKKLFSDCLIIPGYFPVELLNYAPVVINKGVTLFSSALNNLQKIENKLFLGIDYSSKVKSNFKKIRKLEFESTKTDI